MGYLQEVTVLECSYLLTVANACTKNGSKPVVNGINCRLFLKEQPHNDTTNRIYKPTSVWKSDQQIVYNRITYNDIRELVLC